MKAGAIIQARMGSTRLPGKVLKQIEDKSILKHVIERVAQSELLDDIIIATTVNKQDEQIIEEVNDLGVKTFAGSEDNVLSRYYLSAKKFNIDPIIRITSDCPLIDPYVIDEIIEFYNTNNYKLVTNAGSDLSKRTFPRGLDVEVFSFEVLEEAFNNAKEKYQLEHVTPYIYENYEDEIYYYKNKNGDQSDLRLTVDTKEDFKLINKVYEKLYTGEHNFYLDEIVGLLNEYPELKKINQEIEQKKLNE